MKYIKKYKKGYFRVRGHWRRYRNGQRTWISTHMRKEIKKK